MEIVIEISKSGKSDYFRVGEESIILGRQESCDIVLNDPSISGEHFKIYFQEGLYWLKDMESKNGVYVNNEPIRGARFYSDDSLQVGPFFIHMAEEKMLYETFLRLRNPHGNHQYTEKNRHGAISFRLKKSPSSHKSQITRPRSLTQSQVPPPPLKKEPTLAKKLKGLMKALKDD